MTFSSGSVTVFISKGGHLQYVLICSKGSPKTKYNPVRSLKRNMSASLRRSSSISTFVTILISLAAAGVYTASVVELVYGLVQE